MRVVKVVVHTGPTLASVLPVPSPVATLGQEYGGLEVMLEVVGSTEEAVEHINTYGSGHTESIATEDGESHTVRPVMLYCLSPSQHPQLTPSSPLWTVRDSLTATGLVWEQRLGSALVGSTPEGQWGRRD